MSEAKKKNPFLAISYLISAKRDEIFADDNTGLRYSDRK